MESLSGSGLAQIQHSVDLSWAPARMWWDTTCTEREVLAVRTSAWLLRVQSRASSTDQFRPDRRATMWWQLSIRVGRRARTRTGAGCHSVSPKHPRCA